MNDEFIKATQSADHLISPAVIESGLKDLTFDEWRELLYNFPQFAPRYYWRMQRPESWREMRFVPQQFAVSVDWVLSNGGNWAQILDENPALFRERCNWAELTGCNWAWLLKWKPELEDLCDWNKLNDDDWKSLLGQYPKYTNKRDWAQLDGKEWAHWLGIDPELADRCNWNKLDHNDWHYLLQRQPQFINKLNKPKLFGNKWLWVIEHAPVIADEIASRLDWGMLNEDDLVSILAKHPEYWERCDWFKLSGSAWVKLLCKWAQLSIDIPSEIMAKCRWEKLSGKDWVRLLKSCPQYVGKCDWTKLSTGGFVKLHIEFPVDSIVAKNCNWCELESWPSEWLNPLGDLSDTEEVNYAHEKGIASWWDVLLDYRPEYAKYRNWRNVYGEQWEVLHNERPELFNNRGQITLDGNGWVKLISENTQFAELCRWEKLDGENWCTLLSSHSQFAVKCDWRKLNGCDWARLLASKFEFLSNCDWWKLNGCDWVNLLKIRPEVADKCDWDKMDGDNWVNLLIIRPEFCVKCDWTKINAYGDINTYDGNKKIGYRASVRASVRRLVRRVGYKSVGALWRQLLLSQPQFADKCDWEKLEGSDLSELLKGCPQLSVHCNMGKLSGRDWVSLLIVRPEFSTKCDWSQLDGHHWADLLAQQPQFYECCEWDKLNGENWAALLREQPQFAYKCDWEKLYSCSPEIVPYRWEDIRWEDPDCTIDQCQLFCWAYLLAAQPQFAGKCDWGRLSGKEWAMLLRWLPQYADKCDWDKMYERTTVKVEFERGCCEGECKDCGNQVVCRRGYYEEPICCWRVLLPLQPQFADKCDWSRLDGEAWSLLLSELPEYADKCHWNYLTGHDWRRLLKNQPQFKTKLLETLGESRSKEMLPEIFPRTIPCHFCRDKGIDLLTVDKHYAHNSQSLKFLFSELKHDLEFRRVVFRKKAPSRLTKILLSLKENDGWVKRRHTMGDQPREFDGVDWSVWLCMVSPEETICNWNYRMQESDWDKLDGKDWVGLLRWKPNLSKYCRWSKLDGSNWARLLEMYPEFAEKCDWEKTKNWTSRDWAMLIRSKPEYATFERMQTFTGSDWSIVLSRQPSLAKDEWFVKLQGKDWVALILSQPQFMEKCDWRKLNVDDWIKLLKKQPEFADKCNFGSFEGKDIFNLALAIPKMAEQCNLDRLYESIGCGNEVHCWFSELLIINKRELFEIQEKCDWAKLSEQDLLWIMRKCLAPIRFVLRQGHASHKRDSERLANATWSGLTGEDIVRLLYSFPQLSTKVDLMKLTVSNWVDLLEIQPTLIGKCGQLKPQIDEEMRRRECERQEQRELARERYEYEKDNSYDDF